MPSGEVRKMKKAARSAGGGGADGHSADDEARVQKLFHPGGKILFKCLKKHGEILIIKWMFTNYHFYTT